MWDLPGPGLEPVSPALAGGFLTTVPPGKSLWSYSQRIIFSPVQKWIHVYNVKYGNVSYFKAEPLGNDCFCPFYSTQERWKNILCSENGHTKKWSMTKGQSLGHLPNNFGAFENLEKTSEELRLSNTTASLKPPFYSPQQKLSPSCKLPDHSR